MIVNLSKLNILKTRENVNDIKRGEFPNTVFEKTR